MQSIFIDKISRACLVVFSLVMAFATFACFYFSLSQLKNVGFTLPAPAAVAGILAVTMLLAVASFRTRIAAVFQRIEHIPHLFGIALILGVAIRVGWWWLTLPEMQVSDGAAYLKLAAKLYRGEDYLLDGHAFWAPGTPLIYAAFMLVLGLHGWLALAVNLIAFVLCGIAVRAIFARLEMPSSFAGLSVALLALWPELFITAGQVSKETLLLSLLSGGFALLLSRSGWSSFAAGLLFGLAALTAPALLFGALVFGFGVVAMGYPSRQTFLCVFAMLIGTALVIAPWTYRNYRILGAPVPVSTNFGVTLHAANQPAVVRPMTDVGDYIAPPEPNPPFSDEVAASRWHAAEGFKFIKEDPGDFLVLVAHRLTAIMGDDSDSAFRSLRSTQKTSGGAYLAAKALCNSYWVILTALLTVFCWNFRDPESLHRAAPVIVVATLATLYAMGVFGVVEGGARHHMGWSWIYSVLLILAVQRSTESASNKVPASTKMRFGLSEIWLRG